MMNNFFLLLVTLFVSVLIAQGYYHKVERKRELGEIYKTLDDVLSYDLANKVSLIARRNHLEEKDRVFVEKEFIVVFVQAGMILEGANGLEYSDFPMTRRVFNSTRKYIIKHPIDIKLKSAPMLGKIPFGEGKVDLDAKFRYFVKNETQ